MRLFIALPLPALLKAECLRLQQEMKAQGIQANYSRPENLHLTLAFIGEKETETECARILSDLEFPGAVLTTAGIGSFKNLWYLRLDVNPELTEYVKVLRDRLDVSEKRFVPHITLARKADGTPTLTPQSMTVQENTVILFQSTHVDGLLTYIPLMKKGS